MDKSSPSPLALQRGPILSFTNVVSRPPRSKKTINSLSQPYKPPLNHKPEYFPTVHLTDDSDHSQKTETRQPPPAPSYPRFFSIKPKGTLCVLSILASLTNAIGKVEPTNLTRTRDHFVLKVLKDSQSLMLTEGE